MMTLRSLLIDGGRKYAVAITTLRYGAAIAVAGLVVAALRPEIAIHVAAICGSFGLLGSVATALYQGANAAGDKWNPVKGVPPAARQSGAIPEPRP